MTERKTVYIGVGSNVVPFENIPKALDFLNNNRTPITAISTFHKTEAIGPGSGPDFVNGIVAAETELSPLELKFDHLRKIEESLGRKRTADKYAPRQIDLDILVYDEIVVDQPALVLPDPQITQRNFLAACLVELNPCIMLPGMNVKLRDLPIAKDREGLEPLEDFTRQMRTLFLGYQAGTST